jgi:GTP cyclohydrolase I
MPDIAMDAGALMGSKIDKVGMSGIEMPVRIDGEGQSFLLPALADAYVSLDDPQTKGIHMSRLYLHLQRTFAEAPLSFRAMDSALRAFIASHEGLSSKAYLKISFDFMTKRPSLLSDNEGWRTYPISLSASFDAASGKTQVQTSLTVTYSSTCPCSAALARQLISEKFLSDFPAKNPSREEVSEWLLREDAVLATPHSQRSYAKVDLSFGDRLEAPQFSQLIDLVEAALQTAVQAAVKREDEQEFALLNGRNLMFCEDAARKIKARLDQEKSIQDYRIEAKHVESLHPHNAVSIIVKDLAGIFKP